MPNQLLDAVKTAVSIHDGDYSSLRGKSFVIRDNIKKDKGRNKPVKKLATKFTINDLAKKIDNLGSDLRNEINTRFDHVEARINNLEKDVKNINARLDYNGLKKLPNNR